MCIIMCCLLFYTSSSQHLICALVTGVFLCFKQKTAYEMPISDWSSDVCSSDLLSHPALQCFVANSARDADILAPGEKDVHLDDVVEPHAAGPQGVQHVDRTCVVWGKSVSVRVDLGGRRILKKKNEGILQSSPPL